MKYRIHTITVSIFFLLVLGGLTIDHLLEINEQPQLPRESGELIQQAEGDSVELVIEADSLGEACQVSFKKHED